MVPYTFIENDRVTAAAHGRKGLPDDVRQATPGNASGPGAAGFEAVDVLPTLTRKAVEYIAGGPPTRARGQALLPLPAAQRPAHAHRAHARVARPQRAESLWRLRDGDRRLRGPGAAGARRGRACRQHAAILHQRQRLLAVGRLSRAAGQGAQPELYPPRLQGRHLGRRASRAVHRPLARARCGPVP